MSRLSQTSFIPPIALATFLAVYLAIPAGSAPAEDKPSESAPSEPAPSETAPAVEADREASVYYPGCNAARAAGAAPIHAGEPGYREEMDGDGDGIACEPHRRW